MKRYRAMLDVYQISPRARRRKLRFRRLNKWYAKKKGYFWHPCSVCGKEYGGHEWSGRYTGVLWDKPMRSAFDRGQRRSGGGTCRECPGDWFIEKRRVIRDVS